MSEDEIEKKVLSALGEIGITFPVSIIYPSGKTKVVKNPQEIGKGEKYKNNLVYFPSPDDCA